MTLAKKKRDVNLGFTSIALASVFLFNANINVIDIIPDMIGYIIISLALVSLSFLNEDIDKAGKFFRYMIIVEACKFLSLLWLFGLGKPAERETGTLLLTFVFAIIEAGILFIAYSSLFEGIQSLGFAHKNTAVLGTPKPEQKSYTEKARAFTLFFVIFKSAMAVLPELSNLTSYTYTEDSSIMYLYDFIGIMRAFGFIIVTVVGIVWMTRFIKYFKRLSRDGEFCAALEGIYRERVLSKRGPMIKFNMGIVFFLFSAAFIFMFDLRFDGVNVTPDFIGAMIMLLAIVFLNKCDNSPKKLLRFAAVGYFASAASAYVAEILFYEKYYYTAIFRSTAAKAFYILLCALQILTTVLFAILVVAYIQTLHNIIKEHTGYVYGRESQINRAKLKDYHKESSMKLIPILIGAVLVVASDIFYILGAERFGYAGALSIIATLIFVVSAIKAMYEIRSDIDIKYMLE